jgi:hypothetical protein
VYAHLPPTECEAIPVTQETEQVLAEALRLDATARALIAETLLESFDTTIDLNHHARCRFSTSGSGRW